MNAPLYLERLVRPEPDAQAALPLATQGVQRYVWESRFGPVLIEVVGDRSYVNGSAVEPLDATEKSKTSAFEVNRAAGPSPPTACR